MKKLNLLFVLMIAMTVSINLSAQENYLKFDGTNDYMPLPQFLNTTGALPTVSACAWVKIAPGEGGWSIIDFDRSEYFNFEVGGWPTPTTDFVAFNTTDVSGTTHDLQGTINVRDGVWHFIAVVYNGVDKRIYVDGVLDVTAPNPHGGQALGTGLTRYGMIGDGSEADAFNGARNNHYYQGDLKKVSMWTKALSSFEITSIMINGITGSESNLDSYYKFNEGSGQLAADSGPNSYDAQLGSTTVADANDPTWKTVTSDNNSLSFNGTDEYFEIPNNNDFNTQDHDNRTLQLWFYAQDVSLSGKHVIYEEGGGVNGLNIYLESGTLYVGGWSEDQSWAGTYHSTTSISSQRWHHVTSVLDAGSGTFDAYLDGVLITTGTGATLSAHSGNISFGCSGGTQYHDGDGSGLEAYFNGSIDEFRAYNRALPLSEIQDNMHRELTSDLYGANMIGYYQFNNVMASVEDISGQGHDGTFTNMDASNYMGSTAPIPYYSVANGDWNTNTNWAAGQNAPVNAWARVRIEDNIDVTAAVTCEEVLVVDGGSLLDNGNLTATAAIVERDYTGNQWHLISSPVTGAVSGMFTGLYLMSHDEPSNLYIDVIDIDVPLTAGQGFSIWNQFGDNTASYTGTLTSTATMPLTRTAAGFGNGWNLVGNPYPSSIDWEATTGWTKNNVNGSTYRFDGAGSGNWAIWNGLIGTNGATKYIASGQGFFVEVDDAQTTGTLGFTNAVRAHDNTIFYKEEPADIVKLKVSGNNFSDETAVYFREEATTGFDSQMDAHKLQSFDESAPYIYSTANQGMAINVLPEVTAVPMNVKVGTETGTYTIETISNGEFSELFLKDLSTGEITDLNEKAYTFSYIPGIESRFELHFAPLAINDNAVDLYNIHSYNKDVYVTAPHNTKGTIMVYDMMGKEIAQTSISGSTNVITLNKSGYYVVKVLSDEGIATKKVFIK